MAPAAIFGITNDALNLAVNLLLLFLVVLWLALVYWTYADAKRRIGDPILVGCATLAALFPFAGTLVYMVVRPPEYLEDVHERELEIAAAEARLAAAAGQSCPYCEYPTERSYLRCPSCLRRLKEPCGTCGKPLDPRWGICPFCEAEVPEAAPARRRRERRRDPREDEERPRSEARPAAEPRAAAEPRPRSGGEARERGGSRRNPEPGKDPDARPSGERKTAQRKTGKRQTDERPSDDRQKGERQTNERQTTERQTRPPARQ